jgi:hypothetical protein
MSWRPLTCAHCGATYATRHGRCQEHPRPRLVHTPEQLTEAASVLAPLAEPDPHRVGVAARLLAALLGEGWTPQAPRWAVGARHSLLVWVAGPLDLGECAELGEALREHLPRVVDAGPVAARLVRVGGGLEVVPPVLVLGWRQAGRMAEALERVSRRAAA